MRSVSVTANVPPDVSSIFRIDDAGWVSPARGVRSGSRGTSTAPRVRLVPSPNFDARPEAVVPSLLVIHNISLPPGCFGTGDIEALFCNTLDFDADPFFTTIRGLRVSAHFLVERDGTLIQFVSTAERAWHAGASTFQGRERCNDFSIGVELEGSDTQTFEPTQYATLAALTTALRTRHAIDAIVGHADIAPGRKTDPGPCFDWSAYARLAGIPAHCLPFASGSAGR